MSYDIRFAVKAENGMYVSFKRPKYDTPTYNVGDIFRKAMDFDFEQGEYYRVSELLPHITKGISETAYNAKVYKHLEPDNGWGSVETVRECLNSISEAIHEIIEWYDLPTEYFYMAW